MVDERELWLTTFERKNIVLVESFSWSVWSQGYYLASVMKMWHTVENRLWAESDLLRILIRDEFDVLMAQM